MGNTYSLNNEYFGSSIMNVIYKTKKDVSLRVFEYYPIYRLPNKGPICFYLKNVTFKIVDIKYRNCFGSRSIYTKIKIINVGGVLDDSYDHSQIIEIGDRLGVDLRDADIKTILDTLEINFKNKVVSLTNPLSDFFTTDLGNDISNIEYSTNSVIKNTKLKHKKDKLIIHKILPPHDLFK